MKYEHEEEVIIAKSWCFSNKRETFYRYDYNNKCMLLKSHHTRLTSMNRCLSKWVKIYWVIQYSAKRK